MIDRTGYQRVLGEQFDTSKLDESIWLPYHLPHWSSRAAARAHYRLRQPGLELLIEADQQPWYPDGDGWTRVSTLATGETSGPIGSGIGSHRFKPSLTVREEQTNAALLTPRYGLIECRARALENAANMVSLWLIGYEDVAEHSAEICVFEIFGRHIGAQSVEVGVGVHPHGDARVSDDFERVNISIDAREAHDYAALWTPNEVSFFVDEHLVKTVAQSIDYPMQLMLSIFEFAQDAAPADPPSAYPKVFGVEWIRVWRDTGSDQVQAIGRP